MPDSQEKFIRPEEFWRSLGLRANQTVIHLGCGPGFYLIPAASIVGAKGKVYGVDVLEHMVEEAGNRARRAGVENVITLIRANLENNRGSSLPDKIADW